MRSRLALLSMALLGAIGAIGVPWPSGAVEFGDACTANNGFETPFTLFEISNPQNPMPTAAPSAGVLTKLRTRTFHSSHSITSAAIRCSPPTRPGQVQIIGETGQTVTGGANSFDAQIPVKAGDAVRHRARLRRTEPRMRIGIQKASLIGGFFGNPGVGATTPAIEAPGSFRVPAVGVVEPDADNDGGDKLQDLCPQSAAIQTACPVVTIDALSLKGKGAVTVLVAVSFPAPVSVTGSVKLGKGVQAKLKAPPQSLTAGPIAKFKLKFPAKLKERLKELDPGQKLRLKVSADATNVTGSISHDKLKVPLKGEGEEMRARISLVLAVAVALATSLIVPSGAAAATEFGDNCTVNGSFKASLTMSEISIRKIRCRRLRQAPESSRR